MGMDCFINGVKQYAEAQANAKGSPRMGTVTSYNPATGAAKVTIQPEGTTTGWLPVLSQSVGSGFGSQSTLKGGEQVLVLPHDGDADSGVIVGRCFSDQMQPPNVSGAEYAIKSSGGAIIALMSNGHVVISDASGSNLTLTNDGNATLTVPHTYFVKCQSFNVQASVGITMQAPTTAISNEVDIGTGPLKVNNVTVTVP